MTKQKKQKVTKKLEAAPLQFMGDPIGWAAWLYYVDGETQEGTAKKLGVSRATIANHLTEAKERGLVKISVDPNVLSEGILSQKLRAKFGLQDVLILPRTISDDTDSEQLRKRAGECGARVLRQILNEGNTVGVAWGRTMLNVGYALPREPISDVTVMQIAGSMLNDELSSPEFCSAMIANRLGAKSLNFHAPAIVSSHEMRENLMKEPPLVRYRQRLKECDIMIFGVGGVQEASELGETYFSDSNIVDAYLTQDAKAIMVGRFLNADGQEIKGPLTDRQISISLEDLKNTPKRILVAAGREKADAIKACLTGGYCTHLVVDFNTASILAESDG